MFRRRNNKEQEKDVLEKEVAFWKTEMEKVVNEKNIWVERYMKASEDNEMLRAELFLVQQDAQSTRAQLEVLRVREECRVAHSPAVGVGSSTGTPQSGRAGFAAGPAACGSFGPSATSVNTSPIKGTMLLRSGGVGASAGVVSPCDRSTVQQLEEQVADLKAELSRANRQVAAAEAAAHAADMRVALLEERLLEAGQELEAARRQTEFMRATAEAHQREANALRAEVLSQRSINDETANETTKILSELSSAQQRCAKLASELSIKEQMVGLLQLQLGDFAAAAAAPGVNSSTAGLAIPLAAAAAVAPSSSRPSRSVSLSSSGWGLGQLPPSGRTSSGVLGVNGDSTVPVADSEPVVELQRECPAAVSGGRGGVTGVEWGPKILDSPEDGGKSPSLGIANGGDGRGGSGSRGGNSAIAGADGSMWAAAAAAAAAALGSFPASIASSPSEPIVCIGSSTGGTPSPIGAGGSSKANCDASAAVIAADTSDVVLLAANTVYTANGDSGAASEVPPEAKLAVPSLLGVAAPSGTAPPSATATTPSAAVAAAESAGPTFQEAAMQVDPTPSHQPHAILRKSLSKGFAAATAAATAGSPQVQPLRPHLHYHQQRPANVPQLQLGSALRGRDGGGAADASAATPTAADSSTTGVSVSTSPATMVGKRVAAEKPKGDEGEPPAPKRMSAIGMASTAMVTTASQLSNALTVAAAIEEASQEATETAVAASAVVVAEATATADVAVTVIVDGGEQKQVPSGVDEPKQDLVSVASSGNVAAAAAAEVAKEEAEKLGTEAEKKRAEEEAQIVQRPATDSFASSKSGIMFNGNGNDARAGEPSKPILDTASTLTPPSSLKPSGSDPTVDTEVAAAGGAVKTGGGPAVLAPRAFRFPGNRAAAAAAAASLAPPKALNTATIATNATSSASATEGIPRTPFGFAARRSSGGAGGSDCGGTPATAAATSTPPPLSAVEPVAAAGTPGGANGATGTTSASRGGVSSTLSLLKRFNSGGLGSEPSRDKSPAPAVVAAAEGPAAGSGLSAVAAAVRRISAGVSDGAATPLAAQDSGTLNSAMQPSTQSSQLTPPKRPTGTGVSTLLNKFNSVSNAGTPPTPPPAPGSVSGAAGNGSGSATMVVPEYCIGGPATRVPASAKIAAMRSAYEKNKS
ncbi:hypothetical protein Vretimale_19087 [Volvox reticuliferus]|uniref:Uncharacterized protein n=1 Tax=Volvox reticuliferus TaxID=1737510 RepID=A0A8J4GW42_9CHLO|nr:hypothetical protein Vretimale_19087 [Volvox reticuliferus]